MQALVQRELARKEGFSCYRFLYEKNGVLRQTTHRYIFRNRKKRCLHFPGLQVAGQKQSYSFINEILLALC